MENDKDKATRKDWKGRYPSSYCACREEVGFTTSVTGPYTLCPDCELPILARKKEAQEPEGVCTLCEQQIKREGNIHMRCYHCGQCRHAPGSKQAMKAGCGSPASELGFTFVELPGNQETFLYTCPSCWLWSMWV
jgi:hypothetical protein